jgi:nucleotide-binding universal stress UspA family protein
MASEEDLMEDRRQSVVVGVTGPGENLAALRFAAEQARRLGADVVIAHAVHELRPPPAANPLISYEVAWDEVGNRVVSDALHELQALDDDLEASTVARHGDPVHVLSELSSRASLVVLQHRDLSPVHRIFTGSTVAGVAAHAHCPVTSVPARWTASASPGAVTVGVHEDGLPAAVLALAAAEAAARGCTLRVMHAWKLDPVYDDIISARLEEWQSRLEATLASALEDVRHEHPDVPVEVEVRHDWPADALAELSEASDLVVVGRHTHHLADPRRLGSIARAVLRTATCPVTVVPV